ncbi:MAG TPA: cupredoxin domain-containing protein [Acidimicrobiales bacterium]
MSAGPERPGVDDPGLERSLNRWLVAGIVTGSLLIAAFPAYRAVEADRREVALAERQAAEVRAGRDLWASNCGSCHGEDGEGVDAPALNSEEFLAQATNQQIHHVTQAGIPGTEMGAWWNEMGGPLTDEQVRTVVAYIFSWRPTAPSRPDWREPTTTTAPATTTTTSPEQAATTVPGPQEVMVTATDGACSPLEIDVPAGQQLVVAFHNEGSTGRSLDIDGLGLHMHAEPGETARATATPLSPGEYPFTCLGTGHGEVLGVGELHAG